MRKAKPDWHGKDEDGDGDRKHGGPAAVASRWQQQRPVRGRDQPERAYDSATRCASTAHGAAPVLGAQRPALVFHAYCTTTRIPN